jgi:hypothetical protein
MPGSHSCPGCAAGVQQLHRRDVRGQTELTRSCELHSSSHTRKKVYPPAIRIQSGKVVPCQVQKCETTFKKCEVGQRRTCAMLMGEPLEPHWLMISGELCQCSELMHTCAAPPAEPPSIGQSSVKTCAPQLVAVSTVQQLASTLHAGVLRVLCCAGHGRDQGPLQPAFLC